MATALKPTSSAWNADGSPRIVQDVIAVDAAEVDASGRLRPIDLQWATALGQIMLAEGQRTPILVYRQHGPGKKPWKLVAGGHRHAAAELFLDLNPLHAIEVEDGALARKQAEIAENLWRRELDPIDRATFLAELYEVLRARAGMADASPQQIAVHARWQKELRKSAENTTAIIAGVYGFTDQLVAQVGLSKRTVEYDLLLARRLSPAVQARLRSHPIARNATQLRALAKLDGADQEIVANDLLAGVKSVSEAIGRLRGRTKPAAEDKRLSAFIGAFQRMSLTEKKGALHQLAGLLPAGFTLTIGDQA